MDQCILGVFRSVSRKCVRARDRTEVRKSICGTEDMDRCILGVFWSVSRKYVKTRVRRAQPLV